jgi:hypothetical protein
MSTLANFAGYRVVRVPGGHGAQLKIITIPLAEPARLD